MTIPIKRLVGQARAGTFTYISQRLHALAACIRNNWRTGASDKRFLIVYDH